MHTLIQTALDFANKAKSCTIQVPSPRGEYGVSRITKQMKITLKHTPWH